MQKSLFWDKDSEQKSPSWVRICIVIMRIPRKDHQVRVWILDSGPMSSSITSMNIYWTSLTVRNTAKCQGNISTQNQQSSFCHRALMALERHSRCPAWTFEWQDHWAVVCSLDGEATYHGEDVAFRVWRWGGSQLGESVVPGWLLFLTFLGLSWNMRTVAGLGWLIHCIPCCPRTLTVSGCLLPHLLCSHLSSAMSFQSGVRLLVPYYRWRN